MDKNGLLRLELTLRGIKTALLTNETIRKLLYYTDIEELNKMEVPTIASVKDNIFLQPLIDVDNSPPYNKRNYITITAPDSRLRDQGIEYVVRVIVQSDRPCWTYDSENFIRPLRLAQEILNTVNKKQFACAGQLDFDIMVETVTNKEFSGYSLLFNLIDGTGEVND